ncbi:UNVERIFIED_ORG: hypothetical protein J2S99_004139 [Atlantibacter hermannii]|nr:hypothetical protein [Atlantibacter hermannii]
MNGTYFLIAYTVLLTPLQVWLIARMVREEDRRLSICASVITFLIQCVAIAILWKDITAEPVLFIFSYMFCQTQVIFQMNTVRGWGPKDVSRRSQPALFSVVKNSLVYAVPWWLMTGLMFRQLPW